MIAGGRLRGECIAGRMRLRFAIGDGWRNATVVTNALPGNSMKARANVRTALKAGEAFGISWDASGSKSGAPRDVLSQGGYSQ